MRPALIVLFALFAPVAWAETNSIFDVRAFGATGDGKTKDTGGMATTVLLVKPPVPVSAGSTKATGGMATAVFKASP